MAVKLNEMEKKQTAVDWLIEQIQKQVDAGYGFNPRFDGNVIDQALQLEKQQIVDAYERGDKYKFEIPGEQYYLETYGKD